MTAPATAPVTAPATAAGAPLRAIDCDVLVAGSGAGGLAAAVTAADAGLEVIVAEKEPFFGGTTARSGGWLWIPGNPLARDAGIDDSAEEARAYLAHEAGPHFDPERVDAFLRHGPEAVAFFARRTRLRFVLGAQFADYHPDAPGGKAGGRSIVAAPVDGRALGPALARLRPPLAEITLMGLMIGSGPELRHFYRATRSPASAARVLALLARHARDLVLHRRPMRLVNGNALVARLACSLADRGVAIRTGWAVRRLVAAGGRVAGAEIDTPQGRVAVQARRGVVLATGGFPNDIMRRAALFAHAGDAGQGHVSPAAPGNTGDGLRLAEAVGARLEARLAEPAAWVPVSRPIGRDGGVGVFPHFVDRAKPGVIAVTRSGRRFCNEADSYHDFCRALLRRCAEEGGAVAAFLIADHRALRRYGLGHVKPAPFPLGPHLATGYLRRGATPAALAAEIGADPAALGATLAAYNRGAAAGEDPAFGRGRSAYNRALGDPDHRPNPCVAPLATPPYYAVEVVMGDLGTFAGLACDGAARVLDAAGRPIPGLYAAGNDASSIMGGTYPGGGITLGPALTFGYLAARDMARDQLPAPERP